MQNLNSIRSQISGELDQLPVYQYAFVSPKQIRFDPALRNFCRRRCSNFQKSWACPPAVGKPEQCVERVRSYEDAVVFTTVQENSRRKPPVYEKNVPYLDLHEQTTIAVEALLERSGFQVYTLCGRVCRICRKCTYPKERCRYPEYLHPCIEGHSIRVDELAEMFGIDYYLDGYDLRLSVAFYKGISATIE
jgi:predicted metal-binding protein